MGKWKIIFKKNKDNTFEKFYTLKKIFLNNLLVVRKIFIKSHHVLSKPINHHIACILRGNKVLFTLSLSYMSSFIIYLGAFITNAEETRITPVIRPGGLISNKRPSSSLIRPSGDLIRERK